MKLHRIMIVDNFIIPGLYSKQEKQSWFKSFSWAGDNVWSTMTFFASKSWRNDIAWSTPKNTTIWNTAGILSTSWSRSFLTQDLLMDAIEL